LSPEEQEALSIKYTDVGIIVVPLRGHHLAVFNRAYQLCGIVKTWAEVPGAWFAPGPTPKRSLRHVKLEDLGL